MKASKKVRVIAFYLPQFHPIPENSTWWGEGFTEWTNVAKAKPFYMGHYQPKIPADLGFYDLRVSETREAQAELARQAGIEGFCYWHYWFAGKRLLETPFNEVLNSKKPDFPFCLCWANHSWYAKTWKSDCKDKLLIEQTYPGTDDIVSHFYSLLPAFKDDRYIRINDKPLFGIYDPKTIPNTEHFISLWNELAIKNGLKGIYFTGICYQKENIDIMLKNGYDSVIYDFMFLRQQMSRYVFVMLHKLFHIPILIRYKDYRNLVLRNIKSKKTILPCIIPNYDHTPRSGYHGNIMTDSTPQNWRKLLDGVFDIVKNKELEENVVFIKSWNEWGEGNYIEPDLKYGKAYLDELRSAIDNIK